MPGSKKQFKKEDVKQWYESFKASCAELGVDLNNPASLMYIKTLKCTPDNGTYIGSHTHCDTEIQFAFIPKQFNQTTGDVIDYVEKKPFCGNKDSQSRLSDEAKDYKESAAELELAVINLQKAYDEVDLSKKSEIENIKKLENELARVANDRKKKFDIYFNDYCNVFREYNNWMLGKQKVFDINEDYDQVEELYAQALEGKLFVKFPDKEVEDSWQIVVDNNNKVKYLDTLAKKQQPEISVQSVASFIDFVQGNAKLPGYLTKDEEKQLKVIKDHFDDYKVKIRAAGGDPGKLFPNPVIARFNMQKPAEVPAPGAWSWFKRIVSFNIVKDDFKKYEDYRNELVQYNTAKVRHEAQNEEAYKAVYKFINTYQKEFELPGAGEIKNPEVVEDNKSIFARNQFDAITDDPSIGAFDDGIYTVWAQTEFYLRKQVAEAPDTILPDGSLDMQKTKAYWDKAGTPLVPSLEAKMKELLLSFAESKEHFINKLNNLKDAQMMKDKIVNDPKNKELTELEKNFDERKKLSKVNAEIENRELILENDYLDMLGQGTGIGFSEKEFDKVAEKFGNYSMDKMFKKVGALFTDNPKEYTEAGIQKICACITRNQNFLEDGTERDYSLLKNDTEILKDLQTLFDIAAHPEKKAEHQELLNELDTIAKDKNEVAKMSWEYIGKSAANLFLTNNVNKNIKYDDIGSYDVLSAFTAQLCYRCKRANKAPIELHFLAFEDNTMKTIYEQGEKINDVQKTASTYLKAKDNYLQFKKTIKAELLVGEDKPEIDPKKIHRKMELGL